VSDARDNFERLKKNYRSLDGADRSLFWVHFVVAPVIILTGLIAAFGWAPVTLVVIGFLMWVGSEAR
jgi:hypothetical protein